MQDASGDDRRINLIKDQLASEIAMHLFVKPIDSKGSGSYIGGDSAGNRIPPGMYSVRYGVEPAAKTGTGQGDQLSNVVDPSIDQADLTALATGADGFPDGYNFAPYSVIPWTNWPDFIKPTATVSGQRFVVGDKKYPEPNGNPLGNPGFGDTRWLRSTEPVRIDKNGVTNPDGDRFSHWPHLSWLPTPANGYRVVKDIADIEANVLTGDMNQDTNDAFGTPYEQWLPDVTPAPISSPGTDPLADNTAWSDQFVTRRDAWFTKANYLTTMLDVTASTMLPNFIKLDDPMGIGRTLDPYAIGVSKSDEWVFGPLDPSTKQFKGTPRNIVSRTFCDTDGDGFTDSFWFLAPVGKERNVRTIIGVSVIDNSAMVDLNVATRADRRTTVGFTPADIALVTSEPENSPNNSLSDGKSETDTLVGLFDNPYNQTLSTYNDPGSLDGFTSPSSFRVQFDAYRWAGNPTYYSPVKTGTGLHDAGQPSFLQALGLRSNAGLWNDYFYGQPVANATITPPTNEPFSGNMLDLFGAIGPVRPNQENPQYRVTSASGADFRAALPNQPFVRPSERLRWFRSAATGQGTMYAETLDGTSTKFEPSTDLFGIPVPTRRFDASDELELRAYAGNNDPSSMSRLERSLNADDNMRDSQYVIADSILRSTVLRGEAGGGPDQLTNPQLLRDLRHKITVVSGQRNEIMPPWLWIGRPYGIYSPNPRETFQNSMLWLGLHPETPGPRDENGNGRIDSGANSELGFGKLDLYRIATSDDPFQDGNASANLALSTPVDGRDFNRAIRYFEEINQKLDLRKPLLVTVDLKNTAGASTPDGVPDRTPDGSLDQFMALSVNDQRLAMQDFVREARGRLRAALRIHSPMTPLVGQSFGLINTEMLGMNDQFADYTDRFYEQFLFTTNTKTRGAASPGETLGAVVTGSPAKLANDVIAYRSAWSTEALSASMAANIATWRSRADLMFAPNTSTGLPGTLLPLRAIHQPILPDTTAYTQTTLEPLALRAVDPSKTTSQFPNYDFKTGTDNPTTVVPQPSVSTADIVFPGIEKHPFFTEVFFGWVYPATTVDEGTTIKTATFDMCVTTPVTLGTIENYKYVALVNGKVGLGNASANVINGAGVQTPTTPDIKRDKLDKIRTPVLVVQVANPWNEPIRLGDFRINIFGTPYDFPDYELDSSGTVIIDSNDQPVPLMLAPGTETEPATATVYLIANVLGNASNVTTVVTPPTEGDMSDVARWDPLFRRRWLDYFDLYEYTDSPTSDPPIQQTSPAANPLFWFTNRDTSPGATFKDRLSRSKLLNAMASSPGKAPAISLSTFKKSLTRNNMARGVTLQRVLKDPATGSGIGKFLEVDRFDGHSELDHWTNTGTDTTGPVPLLPMFADDRNFDTNLVTGGRFWTSAACITLPPTTGMPGNLGVGGLTIDLPVLLGSVPDPLPTGAVASDYSYDGPGASASLFPPPTAAELVRTSAVKFRYLPTPPGSTQCDVTAGATTLPPDSTDAPPLFPGIVLGKVIKSDIKADGDYFTTWTHVTRNWSRLFDAKFVTVPALRIPNAKLSISAQTNLPVWNYTRQLVAGSFASNPDPITSTASRSPLIPVERRAPRFIFSNRTEPEFTNRPQLLQPTRIELSGLIIDPRSSGSTANGGNVISGSQVDLAMTPWCLKGSIQFDPSFTSKGDIFSLGSSSDDPDNWTPAFGSTGWMIPTNVAPKVIYNMLLTPVWAPLPDFCGLVPTERDIQDEIIPTAKWPALVLRKPTSFNCQTVFVSTAPNDNPALPLVTGQKLIAYYGNPLSAPDPDSLSTQFVLPQWAAPPGSGSAISPNSLYRVYMADKGARLLDHDGFLLPIDLATGGEVVANPLATPPILPRPWLARGLWNTLDRVPQAQSLQMLQKDDDFEQIGELLDVFVWGPAYRIDSTSNALLDSGANFTPVSIPFNGSTLLATVPNDQAKATFAEIMSNRVPGFPVGEGPFINRIQVDPLNVAFSGGGSQSFPYQFGGTSALRTPYAPNVPWGMRIFDCFTVDGAGAALRFDWTNNSTANVTEIQKGGSTTLSDRNTLSSSGRPVGALVPVDVRSTINTASTTPVTPQILAQWEYDRSPSLSGNFSGLPTKGLLNINTASMEAMKALPQMTMMVYEDTGRFDGEPGRNTPIADQIPQPGSSGGNRYVRAPLAIEIYRNQLDPNLDTLLWEPQAGDPMATASGNTALYPTYVDRGESILTGSGGKTQPITLPLSKQTIPKVAYNTGMQSQRGISTVGELIGIARQSSAQNGMSFTMRTAGTNPYSKTTTQGWSARDTSSSLTRDPLDARLSTDRQGVRQFDFITGKAIADRQVLTYDASYGDSEELNLLFKGISNLVTTRSDVFTVYFKVRTVKQNPIDGKWNGTDREAVLDDARYVMCVDRTNVNRPSDQPRIVYFSRVPD